MGKDGDSSSHLVEVWVAPDELPILALDDSVESIQDLHERMEQFITSDNVHVCFVEKLSLFCGTHTTIP